MNRKKFTKRLPIRIGLHDDENDAAAISANLFLRRAALLLEFPDANGQRLGTVKIEHHSGEINLVYWNTDAIKTNDAGTVVPLCKSLHPHATNNNAERTLDANRYKFE